MKNRVLQKQSFLNLSLVLLIVGLISYLSTFLFFRLDLTSEKRYTLTEPSKNLLSNLNDVVYIRIYLEGEDLPVGFKRLRNSTRELLDEFRIYAGKNVEYEFINPSESEDEEIRTQTYQGLYDMGLTPINLQEKDAEGRTSQKVIFPGAIVVYKGYELAVNLLKNKQGVTPEANLNNSIQSLEYEITNAIRKLSDEKRLFVGFAQGHGELTDDELQSAAVLLMEYYELDRVNFDSTTTRLDTTISTLIFAKPTKPFSEREKYVLDQYLMQGGKIMWFLEGTTATMDSLSRTSASSIVIANSLNLEDMLFKYGVRINNNNIQDFNCAPLMLSVPGAGNQPELQAFPWFFYPLLTSNGSHQITKYMNLVLTDFVSSIDTVGINDGLKKTVLLQTSNHSKVYNVPYEFGLHMLNDNLTERDFLLLPQKVAVLVEGTFESAFKNRVSRNVTNNPADFIEKSEKTKIIVVGDGDIIKNDVLPSGEVLPMGYHRDAQTLFEGNKEFLLNAVNYLCDDAGLMSIRLRELKLRMLDRQKVAVNGTLWQVINTIVPLVLILIFGLLLNYRRKRKYSK